MAKKDETKYEIGYGKPPKHTQFKPGHSGNRNGRPKNSIAPNAVALRQLLKVVTVTVDGKAKKVSMLEAILAKHSVKAAQGDARSTALMLDLVKPVETELGNRLPELLQEFREKNAQQPTTKKKSRESSDDTQRGNSQE